MDYAYGFAGLGIGLALLGALLFLLHNRRVGSLPRKSAQVVPRKASAQPQRSRRGLVDKASRNGLERIHADVRRFGWHGVRVKGRSGGAGYLFTVGLWQTYRHPEILLFAPEEDPSGMLKPLQKVCQAVSEDTVFSAEQAHPRLFDDFPGVFGEVDPTWYGEYFGAARAFYGDESFPALQLFWPDRQGLFPWEDSCAAPVRAWQPLLFEEAPAEAPRPGRTLTPPQGQDPDAAGEGLRLRASDLFADLSEVDPKHLIKDWLWLTGEELHPFQVTIFGDLFLASQDGSIYFLDTGRGTLQEAAPDQRSWKSRLADPPAEWFHTNVLMDLLENGPRPAAGKVFSWKVPLSANGEERAENVSVADARLHLGQAARAARAALS